MYRFNGHDLRMDRQLEAMLMVMEAFENYGTKVKVSIQNVKKSQFMKIFLITMRQYKGYIYGHGGIRELGNKGQSKYVKGQYLCTSRLKF